MGGSVLLVEWLVQQILVIIDEVTSVEAFVGKDNYIRRDLDAKLPYTDPALLPIK